jgi:hypothetical protein
MITHKLNLGGLQFLWSATNKWSDKDVWYIHKYLMKDKWIFNTFRVSLGKIIISYYWGR